LTEHQDVGLADGNVAAELQILDPFEMVVRGNSQNFFGVLLTDDVLIELLVDAPRRDVQEAVDVTLFLHGGRE